MSPKPSKKRTPLKELKAKLEKWRAERPSRVASSDGLEKSEADLSAIESEYAAFEATCDATCASFRQRLTEQTVDLNQRRFDRYFVIKRVSIDRAFAKLEHLEGHKEWAIEAIREAPPTPAEFPASPVNPNYFDVDYPIRPPI